MLGRAGSSMMLGLRLLLPLIGPGTPRPVNLAGTQLTFNGTPITIA